MLKNERVRVEMAKAGINQSKLSEILDKDPECKLVFATGHEEYMGEAFEVYAFDYLVKPFNLERLDATLDRIREMDEKQRAMRVIFLDPEEILLIQREDRATVMYTVGEGRYVIPETMQEIEDKLDSSVFFRCHKSYIINIHHIRNITPYGRWTYVIQLDGTRHDALITHDKYDELEKRFS